MDISSVYLEKFNERQSEKDFKLVVSRTSNFEILVLFKLILEEKLEKDVKGKALLRKVDSKLKKLRRDYVKS
jgi:hypothetical protein